MQARGVAGAPTPRDARVWTTPIVRRGDHRGRPGRFRCDALVGRAFYQRVKALARFIKPEEIRPGRDSNGSSVRASSARQHAAESSRPRVRFGAGASRPPTRRRRAHERRRGRRARRARRQARRRWTATTWTTARNPRRRQRPRPRRRGQRRRRQTGSRRARGIASRRVSVACAADAGCGQAVVMLILLVPASWWWWCCCCCC